MEGLRKEGGIKWGVEEEGKRPVFRHTIKIF